MSRELKFLIVCFVLVLTISLSQFFANEMFFVVSKVEATIGGGSAVEAKEGDCNIRFFAHRACTPAYDHKSEEEDIEAGILRAIAQGVRNIEIDITVLEDEVVLRHDQLLKVKELTAEKVRAAYPNLLTLTQFFERYDGKFQNVLFDVKWVAGSKRGAAFRMAEYPFVPNRHFIVGRSCNFLALVQELTKINASCELQGVIGNWGLGFQHVSSSFSALSPFQSTLIERLGLKTILWTFSEAKEAKYYCHLNPEIALVKSTEAWNCSLL